jgi:hypothetical protein
LLIAGVLVLAEDIRQRAAGFMQPVLSAFAVEVFQRGPTVGDDDPRSRRVNQYPLRAVRHFEVDGGQRFFADYEDCAGAHLLEGF